MLFLASPSWTGFSQLSSWGILNVFNKLGKLFSLHETKTSDPIKQGNFLCLCFQKHRALEKIRNKNIRRQAAFFLFNFQCAKNDLYMQETGKILFPVIRPRITLVNSTMRHAGGKKIFLFSSSRETVLCSQN